MVLETEKEEESQTEEGFGGGLFVKVMTDEQLELLRHQISVYATICDQLADLHKSFTSQQHHLSGMKLGSLHYDPLMAYGGHKITSRQRWSPTATQLQVLERIFDEGNGTPTKQKIKDITTELAQHGQISETNVYNWFQNRRARSKRKQSSTAPNNAEPEAESETHDYLKDNAKPEDTDLYGNSAEPSHDRVYFPSPEELLCWSENRSVIEQQHGLQSWPGFGVEDL